MIIGLIVVLGLVRLAPLLKLLDGALVLLIRTVVGVYCDIVS